MTPHKKKYMNFFEYSQADWIPCEKCGTTAVEIHHLQFRSKGGTNDIRNLMALCRNCHTQAHDNPEFNNKLKGIHIREVSVWKNCTGK